VTKPPEKPAKSFTVERVQDDAVGEHIALCPTDPIHGRNGCTILAFCLPLDEARELGKELIRLSMEKCQ